MESEFNLGSLYNFFPFQCTELVWFLWLKLWFPVGSTSGCRRKCHKTHPQWRGVEWERHWTAVFGFAVETHRSKVLLMILQPSWWFWLGVLDGSYLSRCIKPTSLRPVWYVLYRWMWLWMVGVPDPFQRIFCYSGTDSEYFISVTQWRAFSSLKLNVKKKEILKHLLCSSEFGENRKGRSWLLCWGCSPRDLNLDIWKLAGGRLDGRKGDASSKFYLESWILWSRNGSNRILGMGQMGLLLWSTLDFLLNRAAGV